MWPRLGCASRGVMSKRPPNDASTSPLSRLFQPLQELRDRRKERVENINSSVILYSMTPKIFHYYLCSVYTWKEEGVKENIWPQKRGSRERLVMQFWYHARSRIQLFRNLSTGYRGFSPGVKRPEREVNNSHPSASACHLLICWFLL
jgi:hypothetical protein